MKKLSILIPAYNEETSLKQLVESVLAVPFSIDFEIVIVDDCSKDRTKEIAQNLAAETLKGNIRVFSNEVNSGKGASILRALAEASGDIAIVQDADFEYEPAEIPKLLDLILSGKAQVVYGSRFLGRRIPKGMAFPNYVANVWLTALTNFLYATKITDMETCYKLVPTELMKSLNLNANRFDFEPEITAKLAKRGIKITEVPIAYAGRTAKEGKKIKGRDFFMAVGNLFRNWKK